VPQVNQNSTNPHDIENLLKDIFMVDESDRLSANELLAKYNSWFLRHAAI
jgi:hypothetical protein